MGLDDTCIFRTQQRFYVYRERVCVDLPHPCQDGDVLSESVKNDGVLIEYLFHTPHHRRAGVVKNSYTQRSIHGPISMLRRDWLLSHFLQIKGKTDDYKGCDY